MRTKPAYLLSTVSPFLLLFDSRAHQQHGGSHYIVSGNLSRLRYHQRGHRVRTNLLISSTKNTPFIERRVAASAHL